MSPQNWLRAVLLSASSCNQGLNLITEPFSFVFDRWNQLLSSNSSSPIGRKGTQTVIASNTEKLNFFQRSHPYKSYMTATGFQCALIAKKCPTTESAYSIGCQLELFKMISNWPYYMVFALTANKVSKFRPQGPLLEAHWKPIPANFCTDLTTRKHFRFPSVRLLIAR